MDKKTLTVEYLLKVASEARDESLRLNRLSGESASVVYHNANVAAALAIKTAVEAPLLAEIERLRSRVERSEGEARAADQWYKGQRDRAESAEADLTAAQEEATRLTDQLADLKVAAGPFVRATRLQDYLELPDNKPVKEWLPGAWPKMRDAKRLVKAVEAVQLGAEILFCPLCHERLPKGHKVCCGVWHTEPVQALAPPAGEPVEEVEGVEG